MKRVACYVRVSTEEQKKHGLSVDSQIVALQDYCKQNNYEIVGIYNDAGLSASKKLSYRKALLQLCDDCKANKIDLIIFTKLDRWFRSVADYYKIQGILDECNVPWKSIWEDYETETSAGKFKVNIMLSVAQAESDRTSERIKAVNEYRRAKGDYVGQAPLGYKVKNGRLVKNPEIAPVIEAIFDTYLKTHSSTKARLKAKEKGMIISRSSVERILKTETYFGNAFGSECEPYISIETFEEIQKIRSSNYREPKVKCQSLFNSLVYCELCNKRMRAVNTKIKGTYYPNYYCRGIDLNCNHDYGITISQNKIEKYLLAELDALIGDHNIEASTRSIDKDREEITAKKNVLESKLQRIGIRFEEGDISIEEYKEKRKAIQQEIASLPSIKEIERIELPEGWKAIYSSLDFDHKKAFWFSIIERINVSKNSEGSHLQIIFKD